MNEKFSVKFLRYELLILV